MRQLLLLLLVVAVIVTSVVGDYLTHLFDSPVQRSVTDVDSPATST